MSTVYKDAAKMQKVSLTFAVFMCFVLLDFKNDFFLTTLKWTLYSHAVVSMQMHLKHFVEIMCNNGCS